MVDHKDDNHAVEKEFRSVVNMTPKALREWLAMPESQSVGMTHDGEKVTEPGGHEAVGHEMGRHIVSLLAKKKAVLTDDDYAVMHKVVGYVHRHLKQRPKGDIKDSRWRRSLMNWGHDPLT
ncbi:DUF3140 domain-containing protein [Acidisphaera sp. L21]|uniref:DUF3140 domain-containing protein n=1 Tax=Acidisphaera sp. L21 TaxID=1641851 RepID=UPI00131E9022|nr:DUF3140 domain-containing protein [Acidisphaera sp. L21]